MDSTPPAATTASKMIQHTGPSHEGRRPLQRRPQSFDNISRVGAVHNAAVSQVSLAFAVLMTQQMAAKGTAMLGFSGSSHLEATLHPFMCLLLRHGLVLARETEHPCIFTVKFRAAHYSEARIRKSSRFEWIPKNRIRKPLTCPVSAIRPQQSPVFPVQALLSRSRISESARRRGRRIYSSSSPSGRRGREREIGRC